MLTPKKRLLPGLLLIPLVLLLYKPTGFPYPFIDSEFSDVAISHYPSMVYLKREILDSGSIPLWSPAILSGYPFAANPLSGLWYPPGWLALLFPLPLGINITAALHLLWGGLGIYYLLRMDKVSRQSAVFGALAFQLMPKLIAHYGAGHITLFYAVNWTPWLLWSDKKENEHGGVWRLISSSILALICLADPRWAAYAGLMWLFYKFAHSHVHDPATNHDINPTGSLRVRTYLRSIAAFANKTLPQVVIAVLLSSPLLVPLIEYVSLSTRSQMTSADILVFSLPPGKLLGLAFPDYGGNHELMAYTGIGVLVCVLLTIVKKPKDKDDRFWLAVFSFSLVYALGSNLPFMEKIVALPGARLLRVPSRSLFLSGLASALIAARMVDQFSADTMKGISRPARLALTAFAGFVSFLVIGFWMVNKAIPPNIWMGFILMLLSILWIAVRFSGKTSQNIWFVGFILISVFDWVLIDLSNLSFHERDRVFEEKSQVALFLAEQEGAFRVYSPSYSLPHQVAMVYGIESADGVDPLHLKTYADFMDNATGVPRKRYSVTIPPFENGSPELDNQNYSPNPKLLGFLNVRYILAEYDIKIEDLEFIKQIGQTRIYENRDFLPRAWVQSDGSIPGSSVSAVEYSSWKPNEIQLSATGPGLLVLSEIVYPGWRVYVDGELGKIDAVNDIFRGINLDSGHHDILLRFMPISVYIGISLFFVGLLVAIIDLRIINSNN
jgi:hypothetical protein